MKIDQSSKLLQWMIFLPLAFWICVVDWAPLELQLRYSQLHLDQEFLDYLNGVVQGTLPAPYIYRLMAPFTVHYLHQILPFVEPLWIDITLKFLLLLAIQKLAFEYFQIFVGRNYAFGGVIWLNLLLVFSLNHVIGVSLIETMDLFNLLFILIGLTLLFRQRYVVLLLLLPLTMLNRETPWILLPLMVLVDWHQARVIRWRWVATLITLAVPYLALRMLLPAAGGAWMTFKVIPFNIPFLYLQHTPEALLSNLKLLLLVGPLGFLAWCDKNNHPPFLKAAGWVGILFIVVHYGVGIIREWRLWMPLFVLWLPLALRSLEARFRASGSSLHR